MKFFIKRGKNGRTIHCLEEGDKEEFFRRLNDLIDARTTFVEVSINPPSASEERKPLSITLKSKPACEIMKQIDEHRMAINDLIVELKMLTAAVESNINQELMAAATQTEKIESREHVPHGMYEPDVVMNSDLLAQATCGKDPEVQEQSCN